jgi:hypothetical protein
MFNNPIFRTAFHYGTLSGLCSFAYFILIYMAGKNPLAGPVTWAGVVILPIFIILGTRHHRNVDLEGYMTYARGVGIGVFVSAVAAMLYSFLIYIFGSAVDPSIIEAYVDYSITGLEQGKSWMSESMYERAMIEIEKIGMADIAISDFYKTLIGGAIVALIVAAIFRNPKPFHEEFSENE